MKPFYLLLALLLSVPAHAAELLYASAAALSDSDKCEGNCQFATKKTAPYMLGIGYEYRFSNGVGLLAEAHMSEGWGGIAGLSYTVGDFSVAAGPALVNSLVEADYGGTYIVEEEAKQVPGAFTQVGWKWLWVRATSYSVEHSMTAVRVVNYHPLTWGDPKTEEFEYDGVLYAAGIRFPM